MVFEYPLPGHERRHSPRGYRDYTSYKPWLRDEFGFRCVYCLWRERWCANGDDGFGVEHFLSQVRHPDLIGDYENLLVACCSCNAIKRDADGTLDPCQEGFGKHVEVSEDGTIQPLTQEGAALIELCRLDRPQLSEARRTMLEILKLLAATDSDDARRLYRDLSAYPDNLPRLAALRPPGGNTKPDGIAGSFDARRERNELPAVY